MVMDRTDFHGVGEYRNAILSNLDVRILEVKHMREIIIIGVILILALIVWRPRKGDKK